MTDNRMSLHVSRADGERYRRWCASTVAPRHGLGVLLDSHERLLEQHTAHQRNLDASNELRRLAEQQAVSWKERAEENARALDEARQIIELQRTNMAQREECFDSIERQRNDWRDMTHQMGDNVRLLSERIAHLESMGFWAHVEAAFRALGRRTA